MFHLHTMGRLAITLGTAEGETIAEDQKPILLVAFLALTPGHRARREHLADLFWPGNGHSTSRKSLRQAIYTLSRLAGQNIIESDGTDLWLSELVTGCDAWELDEAIAASDHQRIFERSTRPFFETMARGLGHEVQEWIDLHNQRRRSTRQETIRTLIETTVKAGRFDEAEWYARAWVLDEELAEEPRAALVRVLKGAGDEAGAYQAYEEYRALLRSAVGEHPSDELANSVEAVRSLLIDDDEWRPLNDVSERLLTRRAARKYVGAILVVGILLGGGAVAAALVTVSSTGAGPEDRASEDVGPPFGGGLLVVKTVETRIVLRPVGDPLEWIESDPEGWPPPGRELRGPYRLTSGEVVWGDRTRELQAPPHPLVQRGKRWIPFRMGEGDVGRAIPSPDGRFYLIKAERQVEGFYAVDQFIVAAGFIDSRPGAAPPRRVLEAPEQIGATAWAPDGLSFALVERGSVDRILVMRPSGELVSEFPFHDVFVISWCGPSRLGALVRDVDGARIVLIDIESGQVKTVVEHPLGEVLACSPDGLAIAYAGAVDLELRLLIVEVEGGDIQEVPLSPVAPNSRVTWLPDALEPVPSGLTIEGSEGLIEWGSTVMLGALIEGVPEGSSLPGLVKWASEDPWVASVTDAGTVFANRAGTTRISATLYGWVSDTLAVTVGGEQPAELALQDPMRELREDLWVFVGAPPPVVIETANGRVMGLRGDGRYTDALVSRDTFALAAGARLEFEFAFEPSRPLQERIAVCLRDSEAPPDPSASDAGAARETVCFRYPARELQKFDPAVARLTTSSGATEEFVLPRAQDTRWTRVVIEVRSDGVPAIRVNGALVAAGPLRLQGSASSSWRISIEGHSKDSPVLIRNVALWLGPGSASSH